MRSPGNGPRRYVLGLLNLLKVFEKKNINRMQQKKTMQKYGFHKIFNRCPGAKHPSSRILGTLLLLALPVTAGLCLFSGDASAQIPGQYSLIGSGKNNLALGEYAFIGNGEDIIIGSGGSYSVVPNGKDISLKGLHSFVMGKNVEATKNNVFVWGYKDDNSASGSGPLAITTSDVFIIYHYPNASAPEGAVSEAKFGIQTTAPQYTMDINGNARAGTVIITTPPNVSGTNMSWDTSTGQIGLDVAELFPAAETVEPGDVVVISPSASEEILLEKSRAPYDQKVVGIVSSVPGLIFEGSRVVSDYSVTKMTQQPPVALTGRVPCKVSLENGPIQAGDLLTTSSVPGHAMKADKSDQAIGTIIGKALEPLTDDENSLNGTGTIMVLIGLQ